MRVAQKGYEYYGQHQKMGKEGIGVIFLVEKISLKFLLVWNTVFFAALTAYELLCLWLIYSPVKSDYFLLLLYERADYCAFAILMPFLLGLFCRFFVASAIEHKNTKACSFYYFYASRAC